MSPQRQRPERTTTDRSRYVSLFYALVALLLVIAVGHLYALRGLSSLYLGLPLWLWLQVCVVAVMLGLAWVAARLVTAVTGRGRGRDEPRTDSGGTFSGGGRDEPGTGGGG